MGRAIHPSIVTNRMIAHSFQSLKKLVFHSLPTRCHRCQWQKRMSYQTLMHLHSIQTSRWSRRRCLYLERTSLQTKTKTKSKSTSPKLIRVHRFKRSLKRVNQTKKATAVKHQKKNQTRYLNQKIKRKEHLLIRLIRKVMIKQLRRVSIVGATSTTWEWNRQKRPHSCKKSKTQRIQKTLRIWSKVNNKPKLMFVNLSITMNALITLKLYLKRINRKPFEKMIRSSFWKNSIKSTLSRLQRDQIQISTSTDLYIKIHEKLKSIT